MRTKTSHEVARLIRTLREQAGLTQRKLADRVGTTQSVISRLESDDYEGHSLSMLYRIGAALNRKIAVTATDGRVPAGGPLEVGQGGLALAVREGSPTYGAGPAEQPDGGAGLSAIELDRLVDRVTQRFGDQGVTRPDVEEAVRWARGEDAERSINRLRGTIKVGAGDVVQDVRRARVRRGEERGSRV
jgi:transcriptional regulator with XRE-family HTH domain